MIEPSVQTPAAAAALAAAEADTTAANTRLLTGTPRPANTYVNLAQIRAALTVMVGKDLVALDITTLEEFDTLHSLCCKMREIGTVGRDAPRDILLLAHTVLQKLFPSPTVVCTSSLQNGDCCTAPAPGGVHGRRHLTAGLVAKFLGVSSPLPL